MMRLLDVQLIICYVIIISTIRNSKAAEETTRNKNKPDDDPLEALESRYRTRDRYNGNYGERHHKRTATELPITFQAPRYESKNYWNHRPNRRRDQDRRTFFEDYDYYPSYEQRNPYSMMSGFYDLMNQFFGKEDYPKPKSGPYPFHNHHRPHYSKAVHEPYSYEFPLHYRPTEANIIPPPQPVRASVVKLEAVTPEPELYPPLDYTTTAKYYPHFLNLLHQVLIENAKNQQINELGFHNSYYDPYINFRPKPVLDRPNVDRPNVDRPNVNRPNVNKQPVPPKDNIIPTTYKPKYYPTNNATKAKYPGSIQDQLPPLKHGEEPKIPYVSASTTVKLPQTTERIPETTTLINPRSGVTDNILFPTAEINTNKDILADFDIRLLNANLQSVPTEVVEIPRQTTTTRLPPTTRWPLTTTEMVTPEKETEPLLSGESTETYRITMAPPRKTSRSKKLKVPPLNDSVELITDLTVRGLSKNKIENVNIPRYINHFNMSNLINYEIDKLLNNQPIEPRTEKPEQSTINQINAETTMVTPMHTVDINDELSLDVKILKDTNWDGFTATEPSTTIENEITTQKIETTPKPENQTIVVETRVTKSVSKTVGFSTPTAQNQIYQNEVSGKDSTITEPTKFRTFDVLKQSSKVTEGRRKYYNRRPQVKLSVKKEEENVTEPPTTPKFVISSEVPNLAINTEESTKMLSTESHSAHTTVRELLKTTTENNEVESLKKRMDGPNFDDTFDIAAMITKPTEATYPKRKYFRRPKKTQHTPYQTQTEKIDNLKFGVINRSNFPKRSKPNVTLSFGSRKVARTNDNKIIKDEIMKFSDEDLKKKEEKSEIRRHLYKRRKYPYLKQRTTERTLERTSEQTVSEQS